MSDALIRREPAARPRDDWAASWLGLAAAPTFAAMAVWTGLFSGQHNMLCMGMPDASPMTGMAPMYVLMSAFHAGPWLKLIVRWGSAIRLQKRPHQERPIYRTFLQRGD